MQGAVHDRVVSLQETIQYQLLDRYQKLGQVYELEIEEPDFDDAMPAYELAAKAREIPLTNAERRELVGLDPWGVPEIDISIWLPVGLTQAFPGGEEGPVVEEEPKNPVPAALAPFAGINNPPAEGEAPPEGEGDSLPSEDMGMEEVVKATLAAKLAQVREKVDRANIPAMQRAVARVLAEQRAEVERLFRERADKIARKPNDTTLWWDEKKWNDRLDEALRPFYSQTVETVNGQVQKMLPGATGKAGQMVIHTIEDPMADVIRSGMEIVRDRQLPPINIEAQPAPIVRVTVPELDMAPFLAAIAELRSALAPKPMRREAIRDERGRVIEVRESFMEETANG
jgi:hypothetical protein